MPTDRLQEIRARLDAATPGPWEVLEESFDYTSVRTSDYSGTYAVVYSDEGRPVHRLDADLIAHAPADIAWLLAENEAFREQIGFLREEVGDSRLVVRSPRERVWEVWRTTRDEKVATFRTKREATAYVEGGGDE